MNEQLITIVVGVLGSGLGAGLVWRLGLPLLQSSIDRWMDERSRKIANLEQEVTSLRDNHIRHIEQAMAEHKTDDDKRHVADAEGRRKIHEEMKGMVTAAVCERMHRTLEQQLNRVESVTVTLGKVEESLCNTARFVSEVNARQIGLAEDLHRMQGIMTAQHAQIVQHGKGVPQ